MTKKPWGDDYVPDDRPWTFPPNAEEVEAKEQAIHQAALALSEFGHAADWNDAMIMAEVAVVAAMRALAKPDEGSVGILEETLLNVERIGAEVRAVERRIGEHLSFLSDNAGVR